MRLTVLLLCILSGCFAQFINYDGSKLYQLIPENEEHLEFLDFIQNSERYDFWSETRSLNIPAVVMVKGAALENFWEALTSRGIKFKLLMNNVQRSIDNEKIRQKSSKPVGEGQISFTQYHRYDEIVSYLQRLAVDYPEKVVLEEFGTSYEGRPLYVIKIGSGPSSNPAVLIDGGIHAREWISPAVTLYTIKQLVENESNADMIANVNWVIVVVLNPDGYEYTHTTNRLWRKTRRPGVQCIGVDMNRNFDFHWMGPGTSANECSETFAGPYAFSEPEAQSFAKLAQSMDNIFLYLGVHSYGQWLLYPWGFTTDLPENADELQEVGERVAAAIKSINGTVYVTGTSPNLTYYVSGTTKDWAMGVAGARLSYTIELPGGGNAGFDLPAEKIMSVCEETWPGIIEFYNYIVENTKRM
ncbi:carboxypeptidase B-like [Onthophagus taurus]|uniref:carboxypeptidase B-like n=1 Tax=Onthophagus taurus TaxID=166361 RepID=UPI000C20623E|nr:carboxypeptidase B-like [Onthophagus taurus]